MKCLCAPERFLHSLNLCQVDAIHSEHTSPLSSHLSGGRGCASICCAASPLNAFHSGRTEAFSRARTTCLSFYIISIQFTVHCVSNVTQPSPPHNALNAPAEDMPFMQWKIDGEWMQPTITVRSIWIGSGRKTIVLMWKWLFCVSWAIKMPVISIFVTNIKTANECRLQWVFFTFCSSFHCFR